MLIGSPERIFQKFKEPKRFQVGKGDALITKALECFLNTDATKMQFGHYFIDGHELYYRTVVTNGGNSEVKQNLIAKKIQQSGETVFIGNSSALGLIGRTSNWGRSRKNTQETEIQRRLSLLIPMLPFSVFTEAGLNLDAMQINARGNEETITRKRDSGKFDKEGHPIVIEETVHFTGSSLFSVEGKQFLFDVDRRELKHKIFNAFLVELPVTVGSIEEAYQSLKPQAILDAEAKGIEVKRQGEFFFIAVTNPLELKRLEGLETQTKSLELRTGPNRPNQGKGIQIYRGKNAELKGRVVPDLSWQTKTPDATRTKWLAVPDLENSVFYFNGKVEHTGREHAALILKGWYIAVPNTAQRSFTITGDVD